MQRKKKKKKQKKHKTKRENMSGYKDLLDKFWFPSDNELLDSQKSGITDTWFNTKISNSKIKHKNLINKNLKKKKTKNLMRARSVELFPNTEQKKFLIQWSDIYRYVYNQTIKYTRKTNIYDFNKLRPLVKNSINNTMKNIISDFKIPEHTIDNSIRDVCKAFTSAMSNLKNGNIKYFKLRYKKSKSPRQTIVLENSCFSYNKLYNCAKQKFKKEEDKENDPLLYIKYLFGYKVKNEDVTVDDSKLKNSFCTSVFGDYFKTNGSIKEVNHDVRLVYNKNSDKFFMFIPYKKDTIDVKQKNDVCSLDPGLRTFQTAYTSKNVIEIGYDVSNKIKKNIFKADFYNRKYKREGKYSYKKKYYKVENKIDNLIDELHYKTCNFLCKNYKVITIGKLSTKSVVSSKKLSKMTKRILLRLSHYKFRMRLKSKAEEYGIKFLEVDESYTSKTCGNCCYVNDNLGSNKVYNCPKCHKTIDRDYNGARNIFIKSYKSI